MPENAESNDVPHVMLVESRFYEDIADELAKGAEAVLKDAGVSYERFAVSGALEVPSAIRYSVKSREFNPVCRRFDAYVALGCVIRGETSHYDLVCRESARALQILAGEYTLAMGFGILTCETKEQAIERAAVEKGNKGAVAALAALEMVEMKRFFKLFPRR